MIDIRVEHFAARVREVEGKTTELIYETAMIAGTMVMLLNDNREGCGDMLLDWLKSEEFAGMVESMAKGKQMLRRGTIGDVGWNLMQKFVQEREKHVAD